MHSRNSLLLVALALTPLTQCVPIPPEDVETGALVRRQGYGYGNNRQSNANLNMNNLLPTLITGLVKDVLGSDSPYISYAQGALYGVGGALLLKQWWEQNPEVQQAIGVGPQEDDVPQRGRPGQRPNTGYGRPNNNYGSLYDDDDNADDYSYGYGSNNKYGSGSGYKSGSYGSNSYGGNSYGSDSYSNKGSYGSTYNSGSSSSRYSTGNSNKAAASRTKTPGNAKSGASRSKAKPATVEDFFKEIDIPVAIQENKVGRPLEGGLTEMEQAISAEYLLELSKNLTPDQLKQLQYGLQKDQTGGALSEREADELTSAVDAGAASAPPKSGNTVSFGKGKAPVAVRSNEGSEGEESWYVLDDLD